MSSPFLGEIRMFAGNFAPRQWALCNGQILPISQNTALFSLLGTNYGGNGQTTFGLPNLQGRTPLHYGQGPGLSDYVLGEQGGATNVTLNLTQIPAHSHTVQGDTVAGDSGTPTAGGLWTAVGRGRPAPYGPAASLAAMNPATIGATGGGQPHDNMSPYLTLTFIIAMAGIFPPRW